MLTTSNYLKYYIDLLDICHAQNKDAKNLNNKKLIKIYSKIKYIRYKAYTLI